MPTTKQIQAEQAGVLTAEEVEQIAGIANLFISEATTRCAEVTGAAQQQAMRADIKLWDAVKDGTVAVKGGAKGVDYSKQRDREEIRRSVRRRLGLPPVDPTLDPNAMQLVTLYPTTWMGVDSGSEV